MSTNNEDGPAIQELRAWMAAELGYDAATQDSIIAEMRARIAQTALRHSVRSASDEPSAITEGASPS